MERLDKLFLYFSFSSIILAINPNTFSRQIKKLGMLRARIDYYLKLNI